MCYPRYTKLIYFICLFIYLFLSRFVQMATGSPVYDCKVFYPSLNKFVIVIIIVIVTDIVIVTIVIIIIIIIIIIINQDDFNRSYYLVFFTFCWWRKISAGVFATT